MAFNLAADTVPHACFHSKQFLAVHLLKLETLSFLHSLTSGKDGIGACA